MTPTTTITAEEHLAPQKNQRSPEQQIRLERHYAKKESARERLQQKLNTCGDDALLDEYEASAYFDKSVQWTRNMRVNGGGIPYIKIGNSVRYKFGSIKAA